MTTIGEGLEWSDDAIRFRDTVHSGCLPRASVHMLLPIRKKRVLTIQSTNFKPSLRGKWLLKGPYHLLAV